jgi:NADH-quinone oxidoreductase subunit M
LASRLSRERDIARIPLLSLSCFWRLLWSSSAAWSSAERMMVRLVRRSRSGIFALFLSLFVASFLFVASSNAWADQVLRAGTVRLVGAVGWTSRWMARPLVLSPSREGFEASFAIHNDGKEPLVVSRLSVVGDAADPRVPPSLVARPVEGPLPVTILPGASTLVRVQWSPSASVRLPQLFAHVVVTTSDDGAGDVAMGIRAEVPGALGPLSSHRLSLLIAMPLLGALAIGIGRALGHRTEALARKLGAVSLGAHALVALCIGGAFRPDVSRLDGNDGLQFIEHAATLRGLATSFFIGADGTNVAVLIALALVGFVAFVVDPPSSDGNGHRYAVAYLTLASAVSGAVLAMDGLLFVFFTAAAWLCALALVAETASTERRRAGLKLLLGGGVAVACLFVAVWLASRDVESVFLMDGTKSGTTFSLPDLARASSGARETKLFGASVVKVAFVFVLVASALLMAVFPAHAGLPTLYASMANASGVLIAVALPTLGTCALLRIGCAVLPDGMRWASGVLVALGAVTAFVGALSALGHSDLRKLAASATTTQMGFVLVGVGSLTPQGLQGALVVMVSRVLTLGLFLGLVGVFEETSSRAAKARSSSPLLVALFALATLAQAGVLPLGGMAGPMLAVLGALPNYPPLVILALVAFVLHVAAHARTVSRYVFVDIDPKRTSTLPTRSLSVRQALTMSLLAAVVVLLGLYPTPLIASTTGSIRDLMNALSPPGPEQITRLPGERSSPEETA